MKDKKCVIGYKTAIRNGKIFSQSFYELKPCCQTFSLWFNQGLARKKQSFPETPDGMNLKLGWENKTVILHLNTSASTFIEDEVKFCPFCGAKIEIKEAIKVRLIERFKRISDGYDEEVIKN
jgi:hypothetical protein